MREPRFYSFFSTLFNNSGPIVMDIGGTIETTCADSDPWAELLPNLAGGNNTPEVLNSLRQRSNVKKILGDIIALTPHADPKITSACFHGILRAPQQEFTGRSIGFEIEFMAGQEGAENREVRPGPYTDINDAMKTLRLAQQITAADTKNPISTLHLNFGMNPEQFENYALNKISINFVMSLLAMFSNSPARFEHGKWHPNNVIHQSDIVPMEDQIGRLEVKGFDISPGTDLALIRLAILAGWSMLDNPELADDCARGFRQIFSGLGIDHSEMEYLYPYPFTEYIEFFGWNSAKGRVYGCMADQRPVIREMVADILKNGGLKLPEGWNPGNEREICGLPIQRHTGKLSFKDRTNQHPFARIAGQCPNYPNENGESQATLTLNRFPLGRRSFDTRIID